MVSDSGEGGMGGGNLELELGYLHYLRYRITDVYRGMGGVWDGMPMR